MEAKKDGKKFLLKGEEEFKFANHFPPSVRKRLGEEVIVEGFVVGALKTVKALIPCGQKLEPVPLDFFVNPPVPPEGLTT